MDPNILFTQVTAGAACAYLLKLIQKWKAIPFITEHTKGLNLVIRLFLSAGATLGISHVWSAGEHGSHVLMVTIPPASELLISAWHWFGQFALQHGWGQIFSLNTEPTLVVNTVGKVAVNVQPQDGGLATQHSEAISPPKGE